MKLKQLGCVAAACLGLSVAAHANEITLTTNQPTTITFRFAHQNQNGQPVFSEIQSLVLTNTQAQTLPLALANYDYAGIVILSANGHEFRPSENQFNHPQQCSLTTSRGEPTGELDLIVAERAVGCHVTGGVFNKS